MTVTTTRHILVSSGSNARGQLASGTVEDSHTFQRCSFSGQPAGVLPEHFVSVLEVASGANHTILLAEVQDKDGRLTRELWGCGDGSSGQLGLAFAQEVKKRPKDDAWSMVFQRLDHGLESVAGGSNGYCPKFIAASWETTYIALGSHAEEKGDVVISIGSNDFGNLGIGGLDKGKRKGKKPEPFHVVDLDDLLPNNTKATSSRRRIKSLNAGQNHVVVELEASAKEGDESFVVGWGASRHGQLGKLIDKAGKPLPSSKPVILPYDSQKGPLQSISLGMQHTVFLHTSGQLTTLGSNRKGQLEGLGDLSSAKNLGCTWNGTYVCVQKDDTVQLLSTGSYQHGQLGRRVEDGPPSASLGTVDWEQVLPGSQVRLACGTEHVLAQILDSEGKSKEVLGWGWNEHGNLGTGLTEDIPIPRRIWPSGGGDSERVEFVQGIWAGCGTSWIYATLTEHD